MFQKFFNRKKKTLEPSIQHIAFPVKDLNALPPKEKRECYDRMSRDGWELTIRTGEWLVMTRETLAVMPKHSDGLYGVKGARPFSEHELKSLHFRLQARIHGDRSIRREVREQELEKTFRDFAQTKGLKHEKQQKILHLLRYRASRGEVIGYEDLKRYPFSTFGDVKKIFGVALDDVLSFQNQVAKLD